MNTVKLRRQFLISPDHSLHSHHVIEANIISIVIEEKAMPELPNSLVSMETGKPFNADFFAGRNYNKATSCQGHVRRV